MRSGCARWSRSRINFPLDAGRIIGAGHRKLYESRHQLSRPEVQAEIHLYTKRLKEAFNALAAL